MKIGIITKFILGCLNSYRAMRAMVEYYKASRAAAHWGSFPKKEHYADMIASYEHHAKSELSRIRKWIKQ